MKRLQHYVEKNPLKILENLNLGIWVLDKNANTTFVNSYMAEMLGYTPDEMLGKHLFSFMDEQGKELANRLLERRKQGIKEQHEFEFIRKDGTRVYTLLSTSPITDDTGDYSGAIAGVQDITELKKTEDSFKKEKEKFKGLIESAPIGISISTPDGTITEANPTLWKMFGYNSKEEYIKLLSPDHYYNPKDRERLIEARKKEGITRNFEVQFKRKDGSVFWGLVNSLITGTTACDTMFISTLEDITQRKQAEENLRYSEERLKILFEFAPDAYYISDLKGIFLDGNKAAEELTGYSKKELIGKSFMNLNLLTASQIPKAAVLLGKNMLRLATGPDEFILNRKGNLRVPVEIRTFPVKIEGKTLVLGIARNITERKNAEEEKAGFMEKILQAEKMVSLGQLASGVAHELNNPLTGILGNAQILLSEIPKENRWHDDIKVIEECAKRCKQIIISLLGFARQTESVIQKSDINYLIDKTLELCQHQIELNNINIKKKYQSNLPPVMSARMKYSRFF